MQSDNIIDCDEILIFNAATRWLDHYFDKAQTQSGLPLSSGSSLGAKNILSHAHTSSNVQEQIIPYHYTESDRGVINSILQLIRFPLMSSVALSDIVKLHPLMTQPQQILLLLEAFETIALRYINLQIC